LIHCPESERIKTKDQPFFLLAIGRTLKLANDPDFAIFEDPENSFVQGVPVGMGHKMTRAPAIFKRKQKWRKYDESQFQPDMENYRSASGLGNVLREQFEAEASLGMMVKMTLSEARERWPGDRLRIAAQGAIEKGDHSFRILHDGTHGVSVNTSIKPRDQVELPTASDIKEIMTLCSEDAPGVHFVLQSDISKAHRRYLHEEADWGLLACRTGEDEQEVWINKVATFGVSSAAYYWGRLASAVDDSQSGFGRGTMRGRRSTRMTFDGLLMALLNSTCFFSCCCLGK